jgi:thioredoxin reductase (NADPH)/alkyl hydroperoxide reductase subunit F
MAASVGIRSVLIEQDALCAKLMHIVAINNVLGGHTGGPAFAAAIAGDVARAELCEVELGVQVTGLRAYGDHVVVTMDNGRTFRARYVIVATGVGPVSVSAVLPFKCGCSGHS